MVQRHLVAHPAQSSTLHGVPDLHVVMHQACRQFFPAKPTSVSTPPWQTEPVQSGIKAMWQKWRAFKQVRKQGPRGWFQAWKAWKAYDKQYRQHEQKCKAARKAVLLTAMQEAEQHAAQHNARGVYEIIKRLAPKQARRRLQLRGTDGCMLTPQEERASWVMLILNFEPRISTSLKIWIQLRGENADGSTGLRSYSLCMAWGCILLPFQLIALPYPALSQPRRQKA